MALNTYSNLQASIAGWLTRTDLATRIPDFITLAEVRFNRELTLDIMETSVTGTVSSGVIAKPADLRELQRIVITVSGREVELDYATPKNLAQYKGQSGAPAYYTKQKNQYYVAPVPDGGYSYELFYIAKVAALSDAAPTNGLLTDAPDVYLYGALLEAAPYLKNDARIEIWATAYTNAVAKLQGVDDRKQQSGLAVRSDIRA